MMPAGLSWNQETFRSSTDVGYQSNRGVVMPLSKEESAVVFSVESLKKKTK